MRFLVIRYGSSCGGIISRYIIDTKESIKIDLDRHFIITGEDIFDLKGSSEQIKKLIRKSSLPEVINFVPSISFEDILKRTTYSFNKNSKTDIDLSMFDIDWFERNMKQCKIDTGGTLAFDIQSDSVFALIGDKAVQVLQSMYPQIWIKDEKLRDMLNKITGICPI